MTLQTVTTVHITEAFDHMIPEEVSEKNRTTLGRICTGQSHAFHCKNSDTILETTNVLVNYVMLF